jgi:hypothetical protein
MGVKINRFKRRVAHELLPPTVISPVVLARNQLDWVLRSNKDGFTPGELEFLAERREELMKMHEDLLKIYQRLKH